METGKRVDMFPLQESGGFALDLAQYAEFIRVRGTRVAVVCNPNNPDGGFLHKHALVQFMDAMADRDLVVIDESFLEFADAEAEPSVVQEAMLRPNVVVLRSPRQELRAARHPLRLSGRQPGTRGPGARHAPQVEPQLLRGARGVHAARPRA